MFCYFPSIRFHDSSALKKNPVKKRQYLSILATEFNNTNLRFLLELTAEIVSDDET
uniref:Uncharacterized protein n=1 Tax=Arion vulgaris TaxID=1028688 RepID=A0A0B7A984_9EUPU